MTCEMICTHAINIEVPTASPLLESCHTNKRLTLLRTEMQRPMWYRCEDQNIFVFKTRAVYEVPGIHFCKENVQHARTEIGNPN